MSGGAGTGKFHIRTLFNAQGYKKGAKEVRAENQKTKASINAMRREFRGMRRSIQRATMSFGPLLLAFGGLTSVNAVAELEHRLAILKGVANATEGDMVRLTKRIRELGGSTQFTNGQVAEAAVNLSRAGFTINETLAALPDTLALAIVGELGLADASRIMADTLRGLKIPASQSALAVNTLAFAANRSNQTISDLGEGMKFVAPLASLLGTSLGKTTAAMSVLADAGLRGTMAGTSMRQVIQKLMRPTAAAQVVLAKFGLTADDVNPALVGFEVALERMAYSGLLAKENLDDLFSLFEARAGTGAATLLSNFDKVRRRMEEFENVPANYADNLKSEIEDTVKGAARQVASAWENFVAEMFMGNAAEPAQGMELLKGALVGVADAIRFATRELDLMLKTMLTLAALWKAKTLLIFVKGLWAKSAAALTAAGSMGALALATKIFMRALGIGLLFQGIGILLDAFEALISETKTWKDVLWDAVYGVAEVLRFLVGVPLTAFVGAFAGVMGSLAYVFGFIGSALGRFGDNWSRITERMGLGWDIMIESIVHAWNRGWAKLLPGFDPMDPVLKAQADGIAEMKRRFAELSGDLAGGLKGAHEDALAEVAKVKTIFDDLFASIWQPLRPEVAGPATPDGGDGAGEGVGADASADEAKREFFTLQDVMLSFAESFQDLVSSAFKTMQSGIAKAILGGEKLRDVFANMAATLLQGVIEWGVKWVQNQALVMIGISKKTAAEITGTKLAAAAEAAKTAKEVGETTVTTGAKVAGITTVAGAQTAADALRAKTGIAADTAQQPSAIALAIARALSNPWIMLTLGVAALAFVTSAIGRRDGGFVSGPGTGRSDSIPAWLSNGEYVMPAAETARSRGLLEAIRAGGVDDSTLGRLGSVFMTPAFAGGGGRMLDDVPDPAGDALRVSVGGPMLDGRELTRGLNRAAVKENGRGYTERRRRIS